METVYKDGDKCDKVYFILEGEVEVSKLVNNV